MSYRLPVADPPKPVCAKCQHRADAKVQDPTEPWRSWFCLATTKQVWPEQYNPITGETRAAVMGHERCIDMNVDGQCTKFAPLPDESIDASYESASWGRVLDDAIEASQRRRIADADADCDGSPMGSVMLAIITVIFVAVPVLLVAGLAVLAGLVG